MTIKEIPVYSQPKVSHEYYRCYDISVEPCDNDFCGWLYKNGECIFEVTDNRFDFVIQSLRQQVDNIIAKKKKVRRQEPTSMVELTNGFNVITPYLSTKQKKLLSIHCKSPRREISIEELRDSAGFQTTSDTLCAYADIAQRLCDEIGLTPYSKGIGDPELNMILEAPEGQRMGLYEVLVMREDIYSALAYIL